MHRLFSFFVAWCAGKGLHADDYTIVIVPRSARAEAYFKRHWNEEFAHLVWHGPAVGGLYDGMMYGVPFKIENWRP